MIVEDPGGGGLDTCTNSKYCENGHPKPNNSGGITITPSSCPSCFHPAGQNLQSGLPDPLQEFFMVTGITPQSACTSFAGSTSYLLCNPSTYNLNNYNINISSSQIPMPTSEETATGLDVASQVDGLANALKWVHFPIVGPIIDTGVQLSNDNGKGYNIWQETSRVAIHDGEGWASSAAGATLAGVDAIPGAITGPGDIIVIGGSYIGGSALTSYSLNQLNGLIVNRWSITGDYIPYEP